MKKELETLSKQSNQQQEFNAGLLQKLQKQQDYIDQKLEQRDRLLMQSIKELMEARQQVAAANTKKWWNFWKK